MKSLLLTLSSVCLCQVAAADPKIVDASQYATLQEAADAIPDSGGLLRIPPGKYQLAEPLRITTKDTRIEGSGTATHLVNTNTDGQPTILIENPDFSGKSTPSKDRLWRVNVANLRITGNEKSGSGIEARHIEEIFIDGITISHHGGHGLHLHFCYEDPRITDSLFTYNSQCGVYLEGCHDIVVASSQFEENSDGLTCIDSFNLTMTGNNLDDHLGDGIVIENTYGSVLSGNMIEECQGWAMVLDRDCYGITLSANVIAHDFAGGIDLRDAHGCAITGNTFTIVKNRAIVVRKDSAAITITGNNFSDTWTGTNPSGQRTQKRDDSPSNTEDNPNEATGILLQACEGVVISGNLFSGLTTDAVTQSGDCRKILIQANGSIER